MSIDDVRRADERVFREAVAALIRSAGSLRPEEDATTRLAATLHEVRTLAELGADAPLEESVRPAHRAVHAYRPVCVDAAADGQVQARRARIQAAPAVVTGGCSAEPPAS